MTDDPQNDGNNRSNASKAIVEHSGQPEELLDPNTIDTNEISEKDISSDQKKEREATTASVEQDLSEAGVGTTKPEKTLEIEGSQHQTSTSELELENEYNEEAMDRVGEALHGIRILNQEPRYSLFKDLRQLEEDSPPETNEIIEELSPEYEEVSNHEKWIERMIGSENEEGIFEETHLYESGEGVTELGKDLLESLEDLESHFEKIYSERAERAKFSEDEYSTFMPLKELRGPIDEDIRFGTGQSMEEWTEKAVGEAVGKMSLHPSKNSINRLYEFVHTAENPQNKYNRAITNKVGRESKKAIQAGISQKRNQGYFKDTNETVQGQDREITKIGDQFLSSIMAVYKNEVERVEKASSHEKLSEMIENTRDMDPTQFYKTQAEELDNEIERITNYNNDSYDVGVDLERVLENSDFPEVVRIYSDKLEY